MVIFCYCWMVLVYECLEKTTKLCTCDKSTSIQNFQSFGVWKCIPASEKSHYPGSLFLITLACTLALLAYHFSLWPAKGILHVEKWHAQVKRELEEESKHLDLISVLPHVGCMASSRIHAVRELGLFFSLWDAWGLPSHHLPLGQPLCNTE